MKWLCFETRKSYCKIEFSSDFSCNKFSYKLKYNFVDYKKWEFGEMDIKTLYSVSILLNLTVRWHFKVKKLQKKIPFLERTKNIQNVLSSFTFR